MILLKRTVMFVLELPLRVFAVLLQWEQRWLIRKTEQMEERLAQSRRIVERNDAELERLVRENRRLQTEIEFAKRQVANQKLHGQPMD